jgi:hypothetical protein
MIKNIKSLAIAVSLMGLFSNGVAVEVPDMKDTASEDLLPMKNELIVAYYGRPGVKTMGVLGQYPIDKLIPKIKEKAAEHQNVVKDATVVPAFNIIYEMATMDPGRDKDYVIQLPQKKLMRYIDAAQKHGFAVFIDVQLGKKRPIESVRPLLKYLKYKNVHLAVDPEFEVFGLDERPGKVIGHITGEDINEVQKAMSNYLKEHNIQEEKILIVHMFRHTMLKNKHALKKYKGVDMVFNLDGHGSPKLKVGIYNAIYAHRTAHKVAGGFKLFFDEDKPRLLTPKQVMGLEPVNGTMIKEAPRYINYQ